MAEGDQTAYNEGKVQFFSAGINLTSDTIKLALVTGYTPNIDTHEFWSDVSANEESGTGYTAGGEALTTKSVTQDNTNDRAVFDADDVTWTGLDVGTPSHAILYKDTGVATTSPLISYIELGRASNGGDYTVQWNATGIATLT